MVPVVAHSPRQRIAERGMILRVVVGSEVHGISVAGQGDRDEMGVCVEPPETVAGLSRFEHYSVPHPARRRLLRPGRPRPDRLRPAQVRPPRRRGQPDGAAAAVRARTSTSATPTTCGRELRANRRLFLSRQAGARFRGYLESQRRGLMGLRSGGTRNQGRADLRERYGFDAKFAMHMVRLGLQGVELMRTGTITLPMPEPDRTWLWELRQGRHTKHEALDRAVELEAEIDGLMAHLAAARAAGPRGPRRLARRRPPPPLGLGLTRRERRYGINKAKLIPQRRSRRGGVSAGRARRARRWR